MQVVGRHYRTNQPIELELADRIVALRPATSAATPVDRLPWIAPGLVDLQINGYRGIEFGSSALTVDRVVQVVEQLARFGVTRFQPTVTTASTGTLRHALATLARAVAEVPRVARSVLGIHLEGPYISSIAGPRGAHPAEHCRPPDWREFAELQQAAAGLIRLVTLSPEFAESPAFIARAASSGVRVALGHLDARAEQIRAAVEAGATLSTHLGNGCHLMLPRHPNYLWDQLAEDRLTATLIADGEHLPPAVLKSIVRAKSAERIILVSDLSGMAGLPPGRYASEFCELEILPSGRLVVAGERQLLAGAGLPIGVGVANVMRYAGASLSTAWHMASSAPLAALGLDAVDLQPGEPADVVLFRIEQDPDGLPCNLTIEQTIAGGQLVFDRGSPGEA